MKFRLPPVADSWRATVLVGLFAFLAAQALSTAASTGADENHPRKRPRFFWE